MAGTAMGKAGSERGAGALRQRLVDPEVCSACLSCVAACPRVAIECRGRQVAIDPELCENCGACGEECTTGAIENWRPVMPGFEYSLEEQFDWTRLPPDEPAPRGGE